MDRLLIQRLSGGLVIGNIGEGTGFGYQDIGQDPPGLMRFGFLDTGRREEEVGSGCPGTGNIVDRFIVKSPQFGDKILRAMNSQLITEGQGMFGLGLPEILVILVIFLFLFGAKKLPQIGEGLGKTVRELRKIRGEKKADKEKDKGTQKGNLVSDLKKEVDEIPGLKEVKEIKETADKIKNITKILK